MNQPLAPTAPIAFIEAGWHADIVARAHDGFADELARLGGSAPPPAVQRFAVPGAFEIPLQHAASCYPRSRAGVRSAGWTF